MSRNNRRGQRSPQRDALCNLPSCHRHPQQRRCADHQSRQVTTAYSTEEEERLEIERREREEMRLREERREREERRLREERREREESRHQSRQQRREEEGLADERMNRKKKKKSVQSRCFKWARGICGVLIVLGLIFVFYVITTLIIDGSSLIDFYPFQRKDYSQDATSNNSTLKKRERDSTKTAPKDSSGKIGTHGDNQGESGRKKINVDQETFGRNDMNGRKRVNIDEGGLYNTAYFPVDLETGDKKLDVVEYDYNDQISEGTERGGVRRNPKLKWKPKESDKITKETPVVIPVMVMSDNEHNANINMNEYAMNHNYNQYRENHKNNFGAYIPKTVLRSPSEDLNRNHNTEVLRDDYNLIPFRKMPPIYSRPRENIHIIQRDARDPFRSIEERNNWPEGDSRRINIKHDVFGEASSESSRYGLGTGLYRRRPLERPLHPRVIDPPITRKRPNRYIQTSSYPIKRRRPLHLPGPPRLREKIRRNKRPTFFKPPPEFRYPSSAESIQDIIEYMQEKKPSRKSGDTSEIDQKDIFKSQDIIDYHLDSDIIIGNQDHIISPENANSNGKFITSETRSNNPYDDPLTNLRHKPESDSRYGRNNESPFGIQDSNIDHSPTSDEYYTPKDYHQDDFEERSGYNPDFVPPVQNTPSTSFKMVIDIYPSENSPSAPFKYIKYVLPIENESNDERIGGSIPAKREIVLKVNLIPEQPTHKEQEFSNGGVVSWEVPLRRALSPLEVHAGLVAQGRRRAITPAHITQREPVGSSDAEDGEKTSDEAEVTPSKLELFDIEAEEEGSLRLYSTIEKGLKELNIYLPKDLKILFPPVNVTQNDLFTPRNGLSTTQNDLLARGEVSKTEFVSKSEGETQSLPWSSLKGFLNDTALHSKDSQDKTVTKDDEHASQGVTLDSLRQQNPAHNLTGVVVNPSGGA